MKNTVIVSLLFLMFYTSQKTFSQIGSSSDAPAFVNKLSNQLAKSSVYLSYYNQVIRIGSIAVKNAGSQLSTAKANRVYQMSVDKVKGDKTLSELNKKDSLQILFLIHHRVPKSDIDSLTQVTQKLYNAFPSLASLPEQSFRNVLVKANTLLTPIKDTTYLGEDNKVIFTRVQQPAMFPGGTESWKRYLERNLDATVAAKDGAPAGLYPVKIQFVVDREGNVNYVRAVEVPKACPSCGLEAVKIISRGPKWIPAMQDGKEVIYQAVQFITFQVASKGL